MDWNKLSPPPDREERRARAPLPSRPRRRGPMGIDVDSARRKLERSVRRRPLRSAAIALACGFVVGRLLA